MICPRCQQYNSDEKRFCESCGTSLAESAAVSVKADDNSSVLHKVLLIVFSILGVIVLVGSAAGYFLYSKNNRSKSGNESFVAQNEGQGEQKNTEISSTDSCDEVERKLLEKHKHDYDSCFKETNTQDANCQKADGLTDSYKENLNILVILDSSGSMNESISGGKKMDIAKKVITDFVGSLPERAWAGLMVYGHKGSNAASSKAVSCAGIEMVYPLSELDKGRFNTAVKSFQPTGYTPIAESLRKAKDVLADKDPEKTTNIIYLVSDGIETCDGDPVAAAKELKDLKVQTMVNIVGFAVDGSAQSQLKAAALAGGGEYYSANTAAEMDKVFKDRSNYLKNLTEYKNCIQKGATMNKNEIQKVATEVKDCTQNKANLEKQGIQDDINLLHGNKTVDYNCWSNIYYGAYNKWSSIYYGAYDDWSKIYYGAYTDWSKTYYGAYTDWSREYYKK